jgi:hypothetical protein
MSMSGSLPQDSRGSACTTVHSLNHSGGAEEHKLRDTESLQPLANLSSQFAFCEGGIMAGDLEVYFIITCMSPVHR